MAVALAQSSLPLAVIAMSCTDMTRRMLIAAVLQRDSLGDELNAFAETYNRFIAQRKLGITDLKLMKQLSQQWKRVERCEGWPRG